MPADASARGLVLVVEDEAAIADVIRMNLAQRGLRRARRARRRGRARGRPRSASPAAIVLDVGLPGMDGIEVCRRLRAAQDWTPVLFVTARDDEVDRIVGLELGADDYVTKPFSPRELVARVTERAAPHARRRRRVPAADGRRGTARPGRSAACSRATPR